MRIGLGISVVVHVSILLAAVIVLPEPEKYLTEPEESIPVEIIEFSDISKSVATTTKKSDPVKNPLPPKIDEVGEPLKDAQPAKEVKKAALEPTPEPEPEPEPAKVEETPPEPDPVKELIEKVEKQPEAEPEPEPEKVEAVAKPIPVPRSKPKVPKSFKAAQKKKKKKNLDLNELAALLNKIDDKRTAPPEPADETGTPNNGDVDFASSDSKAAASLTGFFKSRLKECWHPPIAVKQASTLIPVVSFNLDLDGNLIGSPVVINSSSNALFPVAADAAIRAIHECVPFRGLPVDKYHIWNENEFNFDPRFLTEESLL